MVITYENVLLLGSLLLILSIFTSKTSFTIGVPTLFIFLLIGVLAGTNGIGNIYFNDPKDAQFIGVIALIIILYSGGLDTKKEDIKPVIGRGLILSFFGVIITAITLGLFINYITKFTLLESFLIASIVSSTDAAAVFGIFKSRNMGINNKIRSLLELESGSNDPTAYLLTVTVLDLIQQPTMNMWDTVFTFMLSLILGIIFGVIFGILTVKTINKICLKIDGLYLVLILALSVLTYTATDYLHGNGYLAVYIAAIILGNSDFVHKRSITKFYDGVSWLMQVVMFIMLGMFVNISDLVPILGISLLIALFLIFAARPIAVALCLTPFRVPIRQQALIAWVGLRGAVPIILAMFPLVAGIEHANTIFSIVFFIAATSLLCQGMLIPSVAKKLGLVEHITDDDDKIDIDKYAHSIGEIAEININETNPSVGKTIMELGLPKQVLIVMVQRKGNNITPNGSTELLVGDKLLVVAENHNAIQELKKVIGFRSEDKKVKKQLVEKPKNKKEK